ncbi:40S ribosomal protein S5-1 [Hordeum vulgare]|nr:40S ribosomal protein S5-1 [Hordeum vulgare]
MSEGMLHIHDVEGPKKTESVETRLEAMEQQVFKCQGMVERGLNANHMMITEFTRNHKMDAIDIGKHLSRLYDRVDQLQGQIYDLQNQNCEYEYRFKSISTAQNKLWKVLFNPQKDWPVKEEDTGLDTAHPPRENGLEKVKRINGPTLMPEGPRMSLLMEMLVEAPYKVPNKKEKKKGEKREA